MIIGRSVIDKHWPYKLEIDDLLEEYVDEEWYRSCFIDSGDHPIREDVKIYREYLYFVMGIT